MNEKVIYNLKSSQTKLIHDICKDSTEQYHIIEKSKDKQCLITY